MLQRLTITCQDDAIDIIPIAFVNTFFGTGGYPVLNLANVRASRVRRWRICCSRVFVNADVQHHEQRVLQRD